MKLVKNFIDDLCKVDESNSCQRQKTYSEIISISPKYIDLREWILGQEKITDRINIILFTNPSARAGYDTRSIFKRSLTGLNSEFSFS